MEDKATGALAEFVESLQCPLWCDTNIVTKTRAIYRVRNSVFILMQQVSHE